MEKVSAQQQIGTALLESLKNMIQKTALVFTKDPEISERNVVEYASRMRVSGLEKFNGPCFVAAVNYYLTPADEKAQKAHGALMIFLEEENAARFLKGMGYTGFHDDDEEMISQKSGELCTAVAENFKSDLSKLGQKDLILSKPVIQKNDIPEGVAFPYEQYKYSELSFHLWKKKIFVVDVVVG